MARGELKIRMNGRPRADTARFILTRARASWPNSYGEADGEQVTVWASAMPSAFLLKSDDTKGAHKTNVVVTDDLVTMSWSDPAGAALVHSLARDPLWGTDWEITKRTATGLSMLEKLAKLENKAA